MTFVYHHRTAGRGGEGHHIMSVVHALEARGHHVVIVSPPGIDPRRASDAAPLDKGSTRESGVRRLWKWLSVRAPQVLFELAEVAYNVQALMAVRRALNERPGAVYYERYAFFLFASVWWARRKGHTVLLEVNEVVGIERARHQLFVPLARWIERQTFRRATHIITVSTFLKDEIVRRGGKAATTHVFPNAIDPSRFSGPSGRERVRSALGLTDAVVVGFAGWFDAWDRLDVLIPAVAELRQAGRNIRILLVGDGPVAPTLRDLAARAGLADHVTLTGRVPRSEMPAYIEAMDICVLPDSNEFGSPMVLFEFMAMGRAIVACDRGPIRDVLRTGWNGVIVAPADAAALKQAFARLMDEPSWMTRMGYTARLDVMANHTWDATVRRMLELLDGVMSEVA
jgi:glycosyltransferase involved in cell wall biosynthesis